MAIDLVNVALGVGGFVIHGADASDWSGSFGVLRRGRQRRRLRRPHHRGTVCRRSRRGAGHARRCRRQLCGVRQAGGLSGGDRPRERRRRHRRLRDPRRGCRRPVRLFGLLRRGHQRRRLRRPHHRGIPCRRPGAAPGTRDRAGDSYVVFGKAERVRRGDRSRERRRRHRRLRDPRGGCGRLLRLFGLLRRGHQRRRLRRPHHRGATIADGPGAAPGTRNYAGDSYVVFGKAGGFGAAIDLRERRRRQRRLRDPRGGCRRSIRLFGLLRRGHQRRRLRRPHHRGRSCRRPRRGAGHAQPCRRQLCGVRQGGRIRRGDRSRERRRRHRRLRHPRGGCGRLLRPFGFLGRRHERRRLRRPHHRG